MVDPVDPSARFALARVRGDGAVGVESRRASDLTLLCRASLGRPPGEGRVVGTPAVTPDRRVLAVTVAVGGRHWVWLRTRDETTPAACGFQLGPWRPLTSLGAAIETTSGVSAASLGGSSLVAHLDRGRAPVVWQSADTIAWARLPFLAPLSAPGMFTSTPVVYAWGPGVRVTVLGAPVPGEQLLLDAAFEHGEWLPGWWTIETPFAPVATTPGLFIHTEFSFTRRHELYLSAEGAMWFAWYPNTPSDLLRARWRSVPPPQGESSFAAPALGFRRSRGGSTGDLMVVVASQRAPFSLYAATWNGAGWGTASGVWERLPDPPE